MNLSAEFITSITNAALTRVEGDRDKTNVVRFIPTVDFRDGNGMTIIRAVIEATVETMQAQGSAAPPPAPPPAEQVVAEQMRAAGQAGAKQILLALWGRAFKKE